MWNFLRNFLVSIWRRWFPSKQQTHFSGVVYADSLRVAKPHIKEQALVVIGAANHPKWLRFQCPCGCEDEIALNLMKSHYPCWTIRINEDNTLSVSPSVDATTCGAHFWIRHNSVDWCDSLQDRR